MERAIVQYRAHGAGIRCLYELIRRYSSASIDLATQIAVKYGTRTASGSLRVFAAVQIVIVKADLGIISLYRPSCRCVIPLSSQSQPGASPQRDNSLNQALTKAVLAHYFCSGMVLQRPRDNLRSRGCPVVYQDHQWHHLGGVIVRRFIRAALPDLLIPAPHFDYLFTRRKEDFGYLYSLVQQTPWIAPQVQNQLAHPALL